MSAPRPPKPETLRFVGSRGHELAGVLHTPVGPAKGSVLMAHCFTCSKDLHTMTRLAKGLAEAGYAALRFDFTGLGDSGGDFARKTVSGNVSDLVRAATILIERGYGPCGLIGHSLGGAAAVLAAHKLKTVRSLVTIGAPSDVNHIRHLISPCPDGDGTSEVNLGGRVFSLDRDFVDDLENHDVLARAAELNRPYLIFHVQDDEVVDFAQGEQMYAAASEPKKFYTPETGGHLLGPRPAAEEALTTIVQWFNETL